MTALDRSPDGALLVGKGPTGGTYHTAAGGAAVCSPAVPIAAPVPIGQAPDRRWCQRKACRRHWQGERRTVAAVAGDGEHVCPVCYVERAAGALPCPSCGAADPAVPETAIV